MDLKKEIAQFRDAYKEGGILTRTFLVLGFFLTLSSLASLSSKIVEWKGFIFEGINFYQLYLVGPVVSVGSHFGLSYSQDEIHTATVSSICVAIGMRILALGQKAAFRVINKKYGSNLKPHLTFYWVVGIAYPIALWSWYGIANPVVRPWLLILVTVVYPIFIVAPKVIMSKLGSGYFEEGEFSYFKSYYAYLGALLLMVCVLAAINTALADNKPKKIQETPNVLVI